MELGLQPLLVCIEVLWIPEGVFALVVFCKEKTRDRNRTLMETNLHSVQDHLWIPQNKKERQVPLGGEGVRPDIRQREGFHQEIISR